jgi:hypothetical protein
VAACWLALAVWASPAGAVTFSQQTVPFSGLSNSNPFGVAVDGSGNVFVADDINDRVVELLGGGTQVTLPFTGLNSPLGMAVDGAGDVFVADTSNDRVVELPAGGTQVTLPFSGLSSPRGVAIDRAGDVFVADYLNNRVVELPAGGTQVTLPFSGLSGPWGLAVDGAGDVFVADSSNNRVVELPAGGTPATLPFSGLNQPGGVAVDGVGDVFVSDSFNGRVVELPAGGTPVTLPFSGLFRPYGLAVDGAGNVFVADSFNHRVVELTPSVPLGSMAFAPESVPAGSSVGVASVTPCPVGGQFGAAAVPLALVSSAGATVATASGALDVSGQWTGTLTVPADAGGGPYFVHARCLTASGLPTQNYIAGILVVDHSLGATGPPVSSGPQGPTGAAGPQGAAGSQGATGPQGANGTNGTNGQTGAQGPQGPTGPQGPAGPAARTPTSETIACHHVRKKSTTCTLTFHFSGGAANARVLATAKVHGHTRTVGRGAIRAYELKLRLRHLHRGRYRLTLFELGRGERTPIAHTTVTVT